MEKLMLFLMLSGLVACNSTGTSGGGGGLSGGNWEHKVEKNSESKMVAEGDMLGGEKQGTWITYHTKNGLVESVIAYNKGVPHGAFIKIDDNGYITEKGVYNNGVFDGAYLKYIRSKIKEEATFVKGKLDGVRKQYFDDGKIMSEENYKMGEKEGTFKYYNAEGAVKFEQVYKNGKKVE